MGALELKLPPPLVTILFAVAIWVAPAHDPRTETWALFTGLLAAVLLLSGLAFIVSGAMCFKKAETTPSPIKPETASSLVTSGIYHYTRNPMYVGLLLVLLAWGAYLNSIVTILLVPLFILYITRFQIVPEERALSGIFGSEYEDYCSRVRRWI